MVDERKTPHTPSKPVILIVDDNPANLRVITEHLKTCGYKTPVASDGTIAIQRAKHIQPDLILLDVVMPGIDGFETCRRLKADDVTKDIPIIFMTALTSLEDKVRGFQEGAVDYITKPIQLEEVLARVSTHLRLRELTRHLQAQAAEIRALNEQLKAENIQVRSDLRESEQKYNLLVEEITEGYFVLQEERLVFANQVFCEMHGYRLNELTGREFLDVIAPESHQEVNALYHNSSSEMPLTHLFQYMRLTQDGQHLPTEMTMKATMYENKPVKIGICRDISERLQMEHRMNEAERLAYIGRITTSLSHEIRNPLSAIKMNLQMLEEDDALFDEYARRSIEISINEVMRLERILNQLLDFAKPVKLHIEPCSFNEMLSSCFEVLRVKFEQKELNVISSYDPTIRLVQVDEEKLRQAVMNLLLNAIEVSEPDQTIWLSSRYHPEKEPAEIEIIIEDEGHGITEQALPHLFEPFFTTKTKGTGLGLTNVKQLTEAHGGRVHAENRSPQGTIFRMWLPC